MNRKEKNMDLDCGEEEESLHEKMRKCVENNDVVRARELIEQYGTFKFKIMNFERKSLYHFAVSEGKIELVQFLLENGWDINEVNMEGDGALYYAMVKKSPSAMKMMRFLVEKGINMNPVSAQGATPLHYAIDRSCIEVVEFLYKNGADPNVKTDWNQDMFDMISFERLKPFIPVFLKYPERLHEKNLKYLQRVRLEGLYQ